MLLLVMMTHVMRFAMRIFIFHEMEMRSAWKFRISNGRL